MAAPDQNDIAGAGLLMVPDSSKRTISKPVAMHQYELTGACGACGVPATRIVVIEMSSSAPGVGTYCEHCADNFSQRGAQGWRHSVDAP